ncbi:MAG TPA: TIGR03986 family CRISPR-associated RAMP protein [Bacillus bacterium]|nr:TIGR03986 family CRISPR-associated RAMP protein [Bacillus sp. (in: firmicutes)]
MGWQEDKNKLFVNPYTFIPLIDECVRQNYSELKLKEKFTGYIECELETKTPIFIPNTTSDKALDFAAKGRGKSYDFYSYTDLNNGQSKKEPEPIIPGSEIRGVIRSMYEALTQSCLSSINEDESFHKRSSVPGEPAIFYKHSDGKWYLEKADRYRVNTGLPKSKCKKVNNFDDFEEGQEVYFSHKGTCVLEINADKMSGENVKKGYIHKTNKFNKKHEAIFSPQKERNIIEKFNNEEALKMIDSLKQVISVYDNNIKKDDNGQQKEPSIYAKMRLGENDKILIYYNKRNVNGQTIYYLTPASISQEVFITKLSDILLYQGNYAPCQKKDCICSACSLFGMVSRRDALSSRLRFTDAVLEQKRNDYTALYNKPSVLNELSSPKPSATEFYLERPNGAELWNYDYAGKWIKINKQNVLKTSEDYIPKVKGRKFYWHNQDWRKNVHPLGCQKLNKLNAMVRPLNGGIIFSFKIFFDGITEDELKNLTWTLNLGSNDNDLCHKIGMGKPLGLGSIKLRVKEIKERKVCLTGGKIKRDVLPLNNIINENEIPSMISTTAYDYVKKVSSFNQAPKNISYPVGKDGKNREKVFLWFVGNRGGVGTPKIKYSLPHISDENQSLPSF